MMKSGSQPNRLPTIQRTTTRALMKRLRSAGSSILHLLMPGQQSAWHTLRSAELWLHHRGSPLLLDIGSERDSATTHVLGSDIIAGEQPQVLVPPRYWQRARPRDDEPTLVSCVVVPGFDYADFGLGAGD